jgi:primase-polymerase (primpol)-like protein
MEKKYKYLPEEMKNLKRFVGWRKEELDGKVAKLPFSLIDGQGKDWNKADRWLNFEEAKSKDLPLGFVLVEEDKIVCIDLDRAIIDGKLSPVAEDIVKAFAGTYMEISQSGQGIHIFAKGSLENNINLSVKGIEMYKNNRYIALTGHVGEGKFFPISDKLLYKDLEIQRLYKKWTQEKPSTIRQLKEYMKESTNYPYSIYNLSLDEILDTMERTNDKASRLISGLSLTGDHSRDDFIFLILARNYTGGDPSLMKDLFLMTPLNRLGSGQKRRDDRKYMDYLEKTIDKVLRLGNFKSFDWANHLAYKERMKTYERF